MGQITCSTFRPGKILSPKSGTGSMDESPYRGPDSGTVSGPPQRKKVPIFTALKLLPILGVAVLLILMLFPINRGGNVREAALSQSMHEQPEANCRALWSYAEEHQNALPPACTTDADGQPLHSWRTLILPYLGEQQLYEMIDLTKPWHDPVNAEAGKMCLSVYQCPSGPDPAYYTTYLAVVTPGSCLSARANPEIFPRSPMVPEKHCW